MEPYQKLSFLSKNVCFKNPVFYLYTVSTACTDKTNQKANRKSQNHKKSHKYLLVSVATIVMLCHIFVSLSSGVAKVIFPSSALMLNCLSRSVWRSMENLQNRHPCNLLNEVGVVHTITRQFMEPSESCSFIAKWIEKLNCIRQNDKLRLKKIIFIIAQGVISCIPSMKVIKCPQVHQVTSLKNGADQQLIIQSITFIRQFLWYFTVTADNFKSNVLSTQKRWASWLFLKKAE